MLGRRWLPRFPSAGIASTLGTDTVLLVQLQAAQQENAKLRKVAAAGPARAGSKGGIGDKLKLATATAQLASTKKQLAAANAELAKLQAS